MTEINYNNIKKFNTYYDKPDWWFKWRYDTQVKRKSILTLIKYIQKDLNNKIIFELGFGSGEVIFSFPKSCEIYGGEISTSAIEKAKQKALKKGYKKFDFFIVESDKNLPISDNYFDVVIASHVLEHVNDDIFLLKDFYRILKKDSILVILIPINEIFFSDPHHIRKYTIDKFRSLVESIGFKFIYGFENEMLSYLARNLYFGANKDKWGLAENIQRLLFNFILAPLPFFTYRLMDNIILKLTNLPPRQAAIIFTK